MGKYNWKKNKKISFFEKPIEEGVHLCDNDGRILGLGKDFTYNMTRTPAVYRSGSSEVLEWNPTTIDGTFKILRLRSTETSLSDVIDSEITVRAYYQDNVQMQLKGVKVVSYSSSTADTDDQTAALPPQKAPSTSLVDPSS